jgi:hypothetical protein
MPIASTPLVRPLRRVRSLHPRHWVCLALLFAVALAQADDRPFLQTSNAVAEDDDEGTWALESWWARVGSYRVFNLAPEYAFSPTTNLQFKTYTSRDRELGDRAHGVETEFKHLFNDIARDGYGWGVHLSLALGSDNGSRWHRQSTAAKLIGTLPLWDAEAKLHANGGLGKSRDEQREWIGSVAYEHQLPWRTTAFVELGREDRETLVHTGLRHWIKRERLAVDFSLQQQRAAGSKVNGMVVGIGWYDL